MVAREQQPGAVTQAAAVAATPCVNQYATPESITFVAVAVASAACAVTDLSAIAHVGLAAAPVRGELGVGGQL